MELQAVVESVWCWSLLAALSSNDQPAKPRLFLRPTARKKLATFEISHCLQPFLSVLNCFHSTMAPDLKTKKRKAAAAPAVANTKKPRKSDSDVVAKPAKVEKKRRSLPVAPVDDSSDEGVTNPTPKKVKKTTTKAKATNGKAKEVVAATKLELLDEDAATPKKTTQKEEALIAFESEDSADEAAGDEAADQTAALLKGFESSSESEDEEAGGVPIEDLPKPPKAKKGKKGAADDEEYTPGVIYVG
jgi:hypothetical protein